jgi:hypothetical protein
MDVQEWLALGIVAACVGALVIQRRRRPATGCGDCASKGAAPAEQVLHFRPRRRDGDATPPTDRRA